MGHYKAAPLLSVLTAVFCAACATASFKPLSDPQNWNGDFMRGAMATPSCPTDTITNARSRLWVVGPLTIDEYEQRVAYSFTTVEEPDRTQHVYNQVSDFVRDNIGENDVIYDVSFHTDPSGGDFWGFSGYVVARGECVVHVSKMSYLN